MRSLRTAGVIAVLAGCNYENPGFKVKGSGTESGVSETSVGPTTGPGETQVSGVPTTTSEPPETTTEPVTSMSTTSTSTTESMETSSDEVGSSTTGEGLNNECMQAEAVELKVVFDTFVVDRSWVDASPCALLDQVAPEQQWEQGTIYCRDRNFGAVAALPLMDVPEQDGRDVIHYLVRFDMKPLVDVNTGKPVQFEQIQGADLQLSAKRTGVAADVGAYALGADQAWTEGNKSGEAADPGQATYRCRVAPKLADPVNECTKPWALKPIVPQNASPLRVQSTEGLQQNVVVPFKIPFLWSDFEGELEGFFSEKEHNGFLIGLPPFDPASKADRIKIFANEAAEADIKLTVRYCPGPKP